MMKTFFVGVKGVVVKDGKVLLLKKSGEEGFWEVPGGRIDGNETLQETLTRELQEELPNIQNIRINTVLDAYRLHKDIVEDVSLTLIFFEVHADFEGDPQISEEHSEWRWAEKDEALSIASQSCKKAIEAVLS